MDRDELARCYFDAWNKKDAQAIRSLLHPQASYYDAFWGETSSGSDLFKYLETDLAEDTRWYQMDGEPIAVPNGVIARYIAFACSDPQGQEPLYGGADIMTISDGLIMTISDHYCDPNPVDLIELATLAEKRHANANIAPFGLSARVARRVIGKLKALADEATIFLDPALTVTKLADHVGCSVMHLFHVLEEEMETSFLGFVNEARVRHATSIIENMPKHEVQLEDLARRSGFETSEEFDKAFQLIFAMSVADYGRNFGQ